MWLRVVSRLLLTTAWALLLSIVTSASAHAAGDLALMKELSGGDCDSLVHWETKPCEEFLTAFCQYLSMRFPGASVQDSFREFCSDNHIDSIRYGTSQISVDSLHVKDECISTAPDIGAMMLNVTLDGPQVSLQRETPCRFAPLVRLTPEQNQALARVIFFNATNKALFHFNTLFQLTHAPWPIETWDNTALQQWFDKVVYSGAYAETAAQFGFTTLEPDTDFLARFNSSGGQIGAFFISSTETHAFTPTAKIGPYWVICLVDEGEPSPRPLLFDTNFYAP